MPKGVYERKRSNPVDRFWAKVDRGGPASPLDGTSCWLWTASRSKVTEGYGQFFPTWREHVYAHRYAYELLVEPVPVGQQLDHRYTCPKHCVNPSHLRLVTQKQNGENQAGAQRRNRSGVRGVTWHKYQKRWRVVVGHNGRQYSGGYFDVDQLEESERSAIELRNRLMTHNDADRQVDA